MTNPKMGYAYAPNSVEEEIQVRTKSFPDLWASVLFMLDLLIILICSGFGIYHTANQIGGFENETPQGTDFTLTDAQMKSIGLVAISGCVGSMLLSLVYLSLMQRYPKLLIKLTFWLSSGLHVIVALLFINKKNYIVGAILLIFATIYMLCYWFWRSRIPLSAIILETVCTITRKYPSSYFVAVFSGIVALIYSVLWGFGFVGIQSLIGASNDTQTEDIKNRNIALIGIFMAFSVYWTFQVVKNVVHVTISGVVGSFYFLEGTASMPKRPVSSSAKRALTSSFGPICFGSLIIAVIQTIRGLLNSIRQEGKSNVIVGAIVDCLLGSVEGLAQYFNEYAFVEVAIYGKSLCQAGKATWNLIKRNGIDAIINDSLISNVLTIGVLMVSIISTAVTYFSAMLVLNHSSWNPSTEIIIATVIVFLISILIMNIVTQVIHSGCIATFVCLAEDQSALARTKPELYERFRLAYPQISL